MLHSPGTYGDGMHEMQKLVVVAIDRDKGSQIAVKWTIDNVLSIGQTVVLVHVKIKQSAALLLSVPSMHNHGFSQIPDEEIEKDSQMKELFLPFLTFCTRKDIHVHEVVLEDSDVGRALVEFVKRSSIDIMVLGAASKSSFFRFKGKDIPGTVIKGAPDYCTIYVVQKGKIVSSRAACRATPSIISPLRSKVMSLASSRTSEPDPTVPSSAHSKSSYSGYSRPGLELSPLSRHSDAGLMKTPRLRMNEVSEPETDLSFVSTGRSSIDAYSACAESFESGPTPPWLSGFSEIDYQIMDSWHPRRRSVEVGMPVDRGKSVVVGRKSLDSSLPLELPMPIEDMKLSGLSAEEVEAEMRRLKQELKQTMDMYKTACIEALSAREKAIELQKWKMSEARKLKDARLAEEAALALVEKEKAKSKAALEQAEAARRLAEMEAQKRINAEMKTLQQGEGKNKMLNSSDSQPNFRYRKYTIDEIEVATEYFASSRKIGEGGYGPVFKCYLDHTPAAVKVLRPDATEGRAQFQQEVEILSCIRHPNMVLLLGACPEYGCLVYEYMSNGSLEDHLFLRGQAPPLSWRQRFRVAAEISTGLNFLHQTKPEPLVHRDLKPANILLDRNYVSKISDVGLARLVPPSVADSDTQYRLTATAGTFCYIDPEYQQTGMLGVKSDVYSLGIILLQILTGKPPMGITHIVETEIEQDRFIEILDPSVPDWPVEETLGLAKLALKCAELRRKDRPDLGKVVLPYLNKMREFSEDDGLYEMQPFAASSMPGQSPVSISKEELSFPPLTQSSIGS